LIVGETSHEIWKNAVKGFEDAPERGERCKRCFDLNLRLAQQVADKEKIPFFCTSLTVSRYKNSKDIIGIGNDIEGFEPYDFKKKGGEERSIAIAKELGLYRQKYCGCEYSMVAGAPDSLSSGDGRSEETSSSYQP
jgi:predicted adenine nucleotide alpha hydrolase (AANH) superfamily ATPase